MQFYKIEGYVANEEWKESASRHPIQRENNRKIAVKTIKFNEKQENYFFAEGIVEGILRLGVIVAEEINVMKEGRRYLEAIDLDVHEITCEEITLNTLKSMLSHAERNCLMEDEDVILERYGLSGIVNRYGRYMPFQEKILDESRREKIYDKAEKLLFKESLVLELDRIYQGVAFPGTYGHPVQYMIQTDDDAGRKTVETILLQALWENHRIQSRRICQKKFTFSDDEQALSGMENLYRTCMGGTLIIRFLGNNETESDLASGTREVIEGICRLIRKHHRNVLTILCLSRVCEKDREIFLENMGNITLVEIKEEFAYGDRARDFLKTMAQDQGMTPDETLFAEVEECRGYLAEDLQRIFGRWYGKKLKTDVYPQYGCLHTTEYKRMKAVPEGDAYRELMGMVGLKEAKKVIQQALDFYKVQKLFRERELPVNQPTMHMLFTGNPGTAKTTVARLFARIMQKNQLLSKGHLIEVGRSDLVGRYVGWTAPTIKKKFKEAAGGVLFIDEAYALVDDRDGSYGDEAIHTIVQEMENCREDTIVIFAGYPDKMERFLQKNPGLRSRIAFHVPFPDYETEELCEIAQHFAKKYGMEFMEDAKKKLETVIGAARIQEDFGNGRYVRNIVEKARMAQASRLVKMDMDSLSSQKLTAIYGEDIPDLPTEKKGMRKIGFV